MGALSMQADPKPVMMSASPAPRQGAPSGGPGATTMPQLTPGDTLGNQALANSAYNTWMQQQQTQLAASGYSQGQINAMLNPYTQANALANTDANQRGKLMGEWNNPGPQAYGDLNAQMNQGSQEYNTYDQQTMSGAVPSTYTNNGITYSPYVSGWNSSMALAKKYQDQVDQNSSAFNKEKAESESAAPTGWAQAERLKQNALSMQAKDSGAQAVASQTAQADDALAAQGGLGSGARERVAEGGAKNSVSMTQGVDQAAMNNDLNIGTTDEQNKLSMLSNVASQENQRSANWMSANQYDEQQQTAEAARLQAWNNMTTEQQNQAYAAQQMANATANSGGGGLFG